MKARIWKAKLLSHYKLLRGLNADMNMSRSGMITLTISDTISITGLWFTINLNLECTPVEWGRVVIPYAIWENMMKVVRRIKEREVELSAGDGYVVLHRLKCRHPSIVVIRPGTINFDLTLDTTPMEVLHQAFRIGIDRVQESGYLPLVKQLLIPIQQNIRKAAADLREYGVTTDDLGRLVASRLGIEEPENFRKLLLGKHDGV